MNYGAQCSEKFVRIVQSDSMPANTQNARHDNMTVFLDIKWKMLRQDEVEICQASRIVVLEGQIVAAKILLLVVVVVVFT